MNAYATRYSQLGAYVLIVVVTIVGFVKMDHQSDQRSRDRTEQNLALCREAVNSREAIRDGIISFNAFLASTVPPEKKNDPQTIKGLAGLKAYEVKQLAKYPKLTCRSNGDIVPIK